MSDLAGDMSKDLSYLEAFSPKALRSAKRIIGKGFTVEDIDLYLSSIEGVALLGNFAGTGRQKSIAERLEKPCCGEGRTDAAVAAFREKQRKKRGEV